MRSPVSSSLSVTPRQWFRLVLAPLLLISGCGGTSLDSVAARGEYTAHGSTWRYVAIDRYTRRWSIGSPHGIVGQVESIERLLWFSDARGAKLAMHDRIYALQRDGSYEHVPCCEGVYVSDSSILQVGSTLVLALTQKREHVTDCIAHAPGTPRRSAGGITEPTGRRS